MTDAEREHKIHQAQSRAQWGKWAARTAAVEARKALEHFTKAHDLTLEVERHADFGDSQKAQKALEILEELGAD